jgi:hypothetical protein
VSENRFLRPLISRGRQAGEQKSWPASGEVQSILPEESTRLALFLTLRKMIDTPKFVAAIVTESVAKAVARKHDLS